MNQEEIKTEVTTFVNNLTDFKVIDLATFDEAAGYLLDAKQRKANVMAFFKPLKEAAHKAHKLITTQEKELTAPFDAVETALKQTRLVFKQEQDRIAKVEQDRLEKKEADRVEKEQEKLLEDAANAKTFEQEEALLEQAEATTMQPVFAPKPVQKTTAIAGGGASIFVKDIKIEVLDAKLIMHAVINNILPSSVIEIKVNEIKKWVKSYGIKPGIHNGFRVTETENERVRG